MTTRGVIMIALERFLAGLVQEGQAQLLILALLYVGIAKW